MGHLEMCPPLAASSDQYWYHVPAYQCLGCPVQLPSVSRLIQAHVLRVLAHIVQLKTLH